MSDDNQPDKKNNRIDTAVDADAQMFRDAVTDARPIQSTKIKPYRERIKPIPRQSILDEQLVLQQSLQAIPFEETLEQGDELIYLRAGVQHSVLRKLRRGVYSIEAELDLHRLTSEQAYTALMDFIVRCQRRHLRCVRIIHGKGLGSLNKLPVLKNKVNKWLRQWDNVLAFCSARRFDGGGGAVYVLLKRN